MATNGLNGVRDNVVQVDALAAYSYGRTDTYAAVSSIPGSGTTLNLPANPQAGDRYEFEVVDGSCSLETPVFVQGQNRQTIVGLDTVTFESAYAWGVFVYQGGVESPGTWIVYTDEDLLQDSGNFAAIF